MADEAIEAAGGKPARKGPLIPVIIVGLIMLLEGGAVYFVTDFLSPAPMPTEAGEGAEGEAGLQDPDSLTQEHLEVELARCRLTNRTGTKVFTISVVVSGVVRKQDVERAQELVTASQARITDRVNFVMRSATQKHLAEPGLETIKRQLKHELQEIFADPELVLEILIPELLQTISGV